MKIAFVGSFRHIWDEEAIARSFEALGHQVLRIEEEGFDAHRVRIMVEEFSPQLVLFAKFKIKMMREKEDFIKWVRARGIKTVSWVFDLYYGLTRWMFMQKDPTFKCDFFLSPDGAHDKEFSEIGINHKLLRQGIFHEYCFRGEDVEKRRDDVVFVGCFNAAWPFRERLVTFLAKNYNFKQYGRDNTHEIRGGQLNDLYSSVKIVVGDSVYSPHYWSNRIYETIGRGGFMIHPMIEGLGEEYKPYEHFVPFKYGDFDSLKEKIDYYLKRPEERKRISDAGMEHTKKHHTLLNRCERLLKIVYE